MQIGSNLDKSSVWEVFLIGAEFPGIFIGSVIRPKSCALATRASPVYGSDRKNTSQYFSDFSRHISCFFTIKSRLLCFARARISMALYTPDSLETLWYHGVKCEGSCRAETPKTTTFLAFRVCAVGENVRKSTQPHHFRSFFAVLRT